MKSIAVYSQVPVLARGLASIIPDDFALMGIFVSIPELREKCQANRPDLLVIDMNPPVDLETVRELSTAAGGATIVIWVDTIVPEFAAQCLAAGVRGVLSKSASLETHIRCLTESAAGSIWVDAALSESFCVTNQVRLTPRERDLMGSLAEGLRNKEIASKLGISEGTVKVYLSRLFDKVGVSDRFTLALLALRNLAGPTGVLNHPQRRRSDDSRFAFPVSVHLNSGIPLGLAAPASHVQVQ
jgi:DNA-binding NarL/FixJ family response regulator